MMDQHELRDQCEAYALGLLEGGELVQLQQRLDSGDPVALESLRQATELVSQAAWIAPPQDPPALLRGRLTASLRKQATAQSAPWAWKTGWAIAAGVLAFAILIQRQAGQLRGQLEHAQARLEQLEQEASVSRRVLAVLTSRDARMIRLATSAPEAPAFRAYWSRPEGLVLVGSNIPAPASGRAMQLWVVPKQGVPISAGVFTPSAHGMVLHIAQTVAAPGDAAALAISDEPAGGSPQPTTKPNWVGPLAD